jgi:D-3-phosphoglycerate dehydrogenase/C-terminal binding protein
MTRRFQVYVTDYITDDLGTERAVLGGQADVNFLDAHREDDLVGRVDDADALLVYHSVSLTARTLDRLTHCRLIVRCGVGYDNVDHAHARRRGIPVANVPDYGTEEVADSAIGLTLALTRGIVRFNVRLQAGFGPWSYRPVAPLHRLRGQVFGIIGLGRIGTATALRAKALGMSVVFFDPYVPDGADKALGVTRAGTLDGLLAAARVLSLHCPLTPETHRFINDAALDKLAPGAFLVNTARGAVVDPDAVLRAIESGRLAGAGLDVLPHEPPADDEPLLRAWRDPNHPAHERVVLNPHTAFYSEEGLREMRAKGAEAVRRVLAGEPPRNIVNA